MIRIDAVWLATEPKDMRAATDTALARVVKVFGAAHPHQAYLFANRRANRIEKCWCMTVSYWTCSKLQGRDHCNPGLGYGVKCPNWTKSFQRKTHHFRTPFGHEDKNRTDKEKQSRDF